MNANNTNVIGPASPARKSGRLDYLEKVPRGHPFRALGREFILKEEITVRILSDVGDSGGYTAGFAGGSKRYARKGTYTEPMQSSAAAIDSLLERTMEHHIGLLPVRSA